MANSREQKISIRKSSEPNINLNEIYEKLKFKYATFISKNL
jgi:hypothetical protein